jgi:hypothetical protein
MPLRRILYLALADARGHLMRAHLLSRALAEDFQVRVVTTGAEGARFLDKLGTPATVLSEHFRVEFNTRHDMSRPRTDRRVLNYLLLPWRGLADLQRLRALARGAALVVNDSLHPALLAAPALGFPAPVVQVYGENLWRALEDNFDGRAPAWLSRSYKRLLRDAGELAFGRIIHAVGTAHAPVPLPRTYHLPPIVARPNRSRASVRQALGVLDGVPLAAVYLNPHFREPSIANAVEEALHAGGFQMHAVGEGYAARPGWKATDGEFADIVHAADLFVSGAGMGALELARTSGTPLLVLLGEQPEQERNVADASHRCPSLRLRAVTVGNGLTAELGQAAQALVASGRCVPEPGLPTEALWREALLELAEGARAEAGVQLRRPRARPLLRPRTG